jgi:hypothetical protein
MGKQDHALHEITDARARMSKLADELARYARPEHVKEIAAEKVSEWKEHAKEAMVEKASELKTHAKEAVMQKTMDVKERVDTPRGWSLLGAIIGAGVGAVLMKKAFSVRHERSIGVGSDEFRYRGERYSTPVSRGMSGTVGLGTGTGIGMHADSGTSGGGGLKEHASDMAQSVKDKAHDLKDRAMDAVDKGTELKGRAIHWFDRALESQPLMLAVGSVALGVFASLILPVSNRERRLIEPAKSKVQESISQLGEQLEQKLQGQETGNGGSYQGSMGTRESSTFGNIGSSEGLMGAERPGLVGSDRSDTLASPTGSRIPPVPPLDDLSTKIH